MTAKIKMPDPKAAPRQGAAKPDMRMPEPSAAPGFKFDWKQFSDWLRANGVNVPTWGRAIVAVAVAVAATVALLPVGAAMCSALVAGAMTLTASAFILNAVYLLGAVIALYFGAKAVLWLAGAILGGSAENAARNVRNQVAWAFTADPKPRST